MKTRFLTIFGLSVFLILAFLSLLFFRERTAFLDIAYHLFYILKDHTLAIQGNRFGAFFTQLFPFVGERAGLSLKTIAMGYSLSFVLLPLITFLIIQVVIKNTRIGLFYLLYLLLFATHTFYWIQSELPQAMAFFFIFVAMFDKSINTEDGKLPSVYFWILSGFLLFTTAFTHPLTLFAFLFLAIYYYLIFPRKWKFILGVTFVFGLSFLIKDFFFTVPYDRKAMGMGKFYFVNLYPHILGFPANRDFLRYVVHDYYFLALLYFVLIGFYAKTKQFLKLALVVLFPLGYLYMVNLSFALGAPQFYIENQYLPLGFFLLLPFLYEVLPLVRNTGIRYGIVMVICVVAIFRIYFAHTPYTQRVNWELAFLNKTKDNPNKKYILSQNAAPLDTLALTWAAPYEFWLLSTMENGQSRSVVIEEKPHTLDWLIPRNKCLITLWATFDYDSLSPRKYFMFTDTTNYVRIPGKSENLMGH